MGTATATAIEPIRTYPGYRTCPHCSYQYWPEQKEQDCCNLCRVRMSVKKTAQREEQRRKAFAPRPCHQCGDLFKPVSPNAKYCSKPCRNQAEVDAHKQHFTKTCPQCGVEFETTDSRRIVCSTRCRHRRKDEQKRERDRLAEMMAEAERKRREQHAAARRILRERRLTSE